MAEQSPINPDDAIEPKRISTGSAGLDIFELVPPEITLDSERELTVLHPSEVDLSETTKLIFERISALNPSQIVVDSLSELRLLAQSPLRYRRQVLALKHFFASRQCTVVLLDDLSSADNDLQLHASRRRGSHRRSTHAIEGRRAGRVGIAGGR